MTFTVNEKDAGGLFKNFFGRDQLAFAGDGGENGVAQAGQTIDRFAHVGRAKSLFAVAPVKFVGLNNATCTVSLQVQDSANGSTWANYGDADAVTVTAVTGDLTKRFVAALKQEIQGARRYIRVQTTITLVAAAAGNTVEAGLAVCLGGFDQLP